jgi:lipoprotein-anchoring transpeptidase ErfK/SrfK
MARGFLAVGTGFAVLAVSGAAVAIAGLSHEAPSPVEPAPTVLKSGGRIIYPQPESLPLTAERQQEVRSILDVRGSMRYGDFLWNDRNVPAGEVLVRVDLRAQTISVFRAGHEIGSAVILYGADSKPTPHGTFPILEKRAQHRSNLYDADMPYMLRLTYDGVAIHGSEVRRGAATHGCIGVPTAFARNLFEAVKRGDEVVIVS